MLLCLGKSQAIQKTPFKNLFQKVSLLKLMEHFLCDDVGGKHNVCGMIL